MNLGVTMEIEGGSKPAMVATVVSRRLRQSTRAWLTSGRRWLRIGRVLEGSSCV